MLKHIFGLCAVLVLTSGLFAQETLPPYHWANDYIEYLKLRGWLPELTVSNRPFSRPDVAEQLLKIDPEALQAFPLEQDMVRILLEEFQPEVQWLGTQQPDRWKKLIKGLVEKLLIDVAGETPRPEVWAGTFGTFQPILSDNSNLQKTQVNAHVDGGLRLANRFQLYTNLKVFNEPDSDYVGKKFRNLYAYAEQSYLFARGSWWQLKLGRDFLQIGPGRSGQLLISDNSRPFDLYSVVLGNSTINFSFWGIQLDRAAYQSDPDIQTPLANRFLNGHRLLLNLKNKFFLGLSEVVVYGGPDRFWELGFINPFSVYYGYVVNGPNTSGNSLFNIDVDFYPSPDLEIYGEFLIDDFQIDKKEPGDLEPNELGFLLGIQRANPLPFWKGLINLEYVQVRNRTYNSPVWGWEKMLHRNRVIGYYLGNNFDRWRLQATHWLSPHLKLQMEASLIRKGEGHVKGYFNKDFLNYTVEQGYHEPFPFGTVERVTQLSAGLFYRPFREMNATLEGGFRGFSNYLHTPGRKHSEWWVSLSLWWEWNFKLL